MEVGGYQNGYTDETLKHIALQAKFWDVNEIIVESNFGDGMFTKVMSPIFSKIHPCNIKEVRNNKQKELRIIDTLEPVLMGHKLIVNRTVIEDDYRIYENNPAYSLMYQMTRLCRDRNALSHDDRLDAVCMAVSYWLDAMDCEHEEENNLQITDQLLDWLENGIYQTEEIHNPCIHNVHILRKH